MATSPIGATSTSSTTSSSASGLGALSGDDFLQLLTAQLKNQSPESAQDPSTFVNQLAMFSQLEQQIDIHSLLQTDLSAPSASTGTSSPTQSQTDSIGAAGSN
jgi:flagellar basal-body rod modification protein FlgD